MFELLDGNKIDWKQFSKTAFTKLNEYQGRSEKHSTGFQIEASFFHILIQALKGEEQAKRLLDYIQKLFEELTDRLDSTEKKQIVNTIFNMLVNVDSKYLNFLGELSVLNLYKRRTGFRLEKTEEPNGGRKKHGITIDFKFWDEANNKKIHIEVVNIHLNEKNTASPEAVNNLLTQKIANKIATKKIGANSSAFLVPVVWGQFDEIKLLHDYYDPVALSFPNTVHLTCFMTFTDPNGNRVHEFGTLNTVFNELNSKN